MRMAEGVRVVAAGVRRIFTILVALCFLQAAAMEATPGWAVFQLVMAVVVLACAVWRR